MLRIVKVSERPHEPDATVAARLSLPFGQRSRSRFRATLADGRDVGAILPRGTLLRGGTIVETDAGEPVLIEAAPEAVSTATSSEPLLLLRAAYHLGNRHVELELLDGGVRYLHDHVLDSLLLSLGLHVSFSHAPFEPEAGAYHAHQHPDDDQHGHEHGHGHDHTLTHERHAE